MATPALVLFFFCIVNLCHLFNKRESWWLHWCIYVIAGCIEYIFNTMKARYMEYKNIILVNVTFRGVLVRLPNPFPPPLLLFRLRR